MTAAVMPGVRTREARAVAAGVLAVAAVYPALPVHPAVACPLRAATGIPCPLCGLTRAVVAAVHGHLGTSLAFNPGGIVFVALALTVLLRPQWLARLRIPWWSVAVFAGALWVWNIGFNPTFHQLLIR